tara:strand:+ start:276 stop:1178 length:903 start_codon:yes stop_codon:yes gene_type:complete
MKKTKAWDAYNTIFAWAKTTPDARISLGGIGWDEQKHAVLLENRYDPRHYIEMGSYDSTKGLRTTIEAPEGIDIKCGQLMTREATSEEFPNSKGNGTFVIQVENGNLEIDVQNGDLKVKAKNIDFDIQGDPDHEGDGNFTVDCNENIVMTAANQCRILATDMCSVSGTNLLRLYSNVETDFITGICNMTSYSSRRGTRPDLMEPEWYVPGSMSQKVEEPPIADSTPSMIDKVKDKAETAFQEAKNAVGNLQENLSNVVPDTGGMDLLKEQAARTGQTEGEIKSLWEKFGAPAGVDLDKIL